jgi:hypothetical protein
MAAAQQTSVAPVKRRHSSSDAAKQGFEGAAPMDKVRRCDEPKNDARKRQRIAALLRNSRKRARDQQNKSGVHKRPQVDDVDSDSVPELLSVEESEARIDAGLAMTLDFGVGTTADATLMYDQEASGITDSSISHLVNLIHLKCDFCPNVTDSQISLINTKAVQYQEASESDSYHDISEEDVSSPIGLTQSYDIDCKATERHASSCTIGAM